MYKVFAIVLAVCLFCLIRDTTAYCCFRDPWTLPCGCPDIETCGVITCNPCSCSCNCGILTGSCFRDTSNVCFVCDNPSPVCSCLKCIECGNKGGDCGSKSGDCGSKGSECGSKGGDCGSKGGACGSKGGDCGSKGGECGNKGGDCGKSVGCGCGMEKSFIYFPEVEYPMIALDMKPYYYSSCYCL